MAAANPSKRGPRLAALEIALVNKNFDTVADLIASYFKDFGHKACFWGDVGRYSLALKEADPKYGAKVLDVLRGFLKEVDWETHHALREFSARELEDPKDQYREKRDGRDIGKVDQWSAQDEARQNEMMRRVGIAKLERTFGVAGDVKEQFRQHQEACSLYRKHLQVTEEGPNDDLLIVAAHTLIERGRLLDAMSLSLAGIEHTPFAFQPKLVLIDLAVHVGAFSLAGEMFQGLDCKYVQWDSMGHFALYPVVQSGDVVWLEEICRGVADFRDQAVKRSVPGDTSKCFSHGKWSQIEGFQHFASRVDGSWHAAACQVELALSHVFKASEEEARSAIGRARQKGKVAVGARKGEQWLENLVEACASYKGKGDMRLVYNYDLRVKANFSSCSSKSEFLASEWVVPKNMADWLRGRTLLMLLIEAALNGQGEELIKRAEDLTLLVETNRDARFAGRSFVLGAAATCACGYTGNCVS